MSEQYLLEMRGISKSFPGVKALQNVGLQLKAGEVHALLGENGAGKSTLIKVLGGIYHAEEGEIYIEGQKVKSDGVVAARGAGISIVHQELVLVPYMTVAENIFVLRQGFRQRIIRRSLLRKQLEPFLEEIGMDISPDSYVEKLSYFERVVVEILRAVILGHRLIVLNEIGTRISETESKKLYLILRKYASQGIAFLYITLHFEEALQICDRMVLVSYGRVQKVIQKQEMVLDILLEYPEEFNDLVRGHMEKQKEGKIDTRKDIVLELKNITCEALQNISIKIGRGECLVVQSLDSIVGVLY